MGEQKITGLIYGDVAGAPSVLLGTSKELIYHHTDAAGWYDLVFTTSINLARGNYWIGVITGATSKVADYRYDKIANSRDFNTNIYTSGPANPFGTVEKNEEQNSIYATYTPAPPVNTTPPTITGVPQQGLTLTEHHGSWTNEPTSFTYQWQQCTSLGEGCLSISGATSQTYVPVAGDVGHTLKVQETAKNAGGSSSPATSSATAIVGKETETWEGFSATNPMPAGRTPGNSESPFNEEVGAKPEVTANSAAEVEWLLGPKDTHEEYSGPIPKTIERPKQEDIPFVYASNKDPLVELVAKGSGNVNGRKIRIPENAHVGGNGDKHLTIVLAPTDEKESGELIDLWQANSEGAGGKVKFEGAPLKLTYTNGSTGSMTGKLIEEEPGSVSAGWDAIAGEIRGPELKANTVPHALAAIGWDTKEGTLAWPASHGDGKNKEAASPPTGRRFYLAYTDKEIEEIEVGGKHLLPWKKAFFKAIAHYGFYLEDTGNNALNFRWEGENMYVPFGASEPFTKIGEEQGIEKSGSHYVFNQSEGVKWKERLHAIEPPAH